MKIRFNIWIDMEDIDALRDVATSKGLSVSAMLRMIVREYMERHKAGKAA